MTEHGIDLTQEQRTRDDLFRVLDQRITSSPTVWSAIDRRRVLRDIASVVSVWLGDASREAVLVSDVVMFAPHSFVGGAQHAIRYIRWLERMAVEGSWDKPDDALLVELANSIHCFGGVMTPCEEHNDDAVRLAIHQQGEEVDG